tara:strand:+ start:331 stop:735 length:405 start_codon:yes stop_codon:yes gene_type:complete
LEEKKKSDFKILITDDSQLAKKVVGEVLQSNGFTNINTASTAEEAYFKSKKDNYHLHIVDIVLPETSGLDLIKSLGEIPSPKMILVTSSLSSETYILDAISSGASDFLKKPFLEKDLVKSVSRLYENSLKEKIL